MIRKAERKVIDVLLVAEHEQPPLSEQLLHRGPTDENRTDHLPRFLDNQGADHLRRHGAKDGVKRHAIFLVICVATFDDIPQTTGLHLHPREEAPLIVAPSQLREWRTTEFLHHALDDYL